MANVFESIEKEYNEIKENYTLMERELNEYKKNNTIVGYIYILENPLFNYMVKIGYAKDVEKRIKELSGSGMPDPYHCYAVYGVTETRTDLEVHNLIDGLDPDLRHNSNREFYEITKERAYKILEAIAKISGTSDRLIINPFDDKYFNDNDNNNIKEEKVITKEVASTPSNSIVDNFKARTNRVDSIEETEESSKRSKISYEYVCVPEGFYHNKKKTAYAYVDKDNNWTILAGSYANTKVYNGTALVKGGVYDKRWDIIEDERFVEDFSMGNVKPSGPAQFIMNAPQDGWTFWYTEDDITIHDAFPRKKTK